MFVSVLERRENLLTVFLGLGFFKMTSLFDEIAEISAWNVFHDHIDVFSGFEAFVEPDNVRVVKLF